MPDLGKRFRIETDACNYGIGAVLAQEYDYNWQPVAYLSKYLSSQQKRYSTCERELLAIVEAIEHFKYFLYGTSFTVLTDHQPLRTILKADVLSPR